jgi:hypothetical protein
MPCVSIEPELHCGPGASLRIYYIRVTATQLQTDVFYIIILTQGAIQYDMVGSEYNVKFF